MVLTIFDIPPLPPKKSSENTSLRILTTSATEYHTVGQIYLFRVHIVKLYNTAVFTKNIESVHFRRRVPNEK